MFDERLLQQQTGGQSLGPEPEERPDPLLCLVLVWLTGDSSIGWFQLLVVTFVLHRAHEEITDGLH